MQSQGRCWQRQGLKEGVASLGNITRVNRFWQTIWATLQKVGTPNIWTRLYVITDEFPDRIVCLTREAFTLQNDASRGQV